jgi:predicted anti-sigma-YlaC factor YlaD
MALNMAADAVASTGTTYASDDDPALVRDAVPFGLKTMEGMLESQPEHQGLLLAACRGFVQYGYAFVQQDADAAELANRQRESKQLRERARKLYLRGRDYGLRTLSVSHKGLGDRLKASKGREDLRKALAVAKKEDVPALYWTAAGWALAISTAKDRMDLVGQLPAVEAMMTRALELDEGWDEGAIHEFFVTYDASRGAESGGGPKAAKQHLDRARALSKNKKLGPLVSYAEGVLVQSQNRAEFKRTLDEVVKADVDAEKRYRLANIIAQQRARLLLAHAEDLFL